MSSTARVILDRFLYSLASPPFVYVKPLATSHPHRQSGCLYLDPPGSSLQLSLGLSAPSNRCHSTHCNRWPLNTRWLSAYLENPRSTSRGKARLVSHGARSSHPVVAYVECWLIWATSNRNLIVKRKGNGRIAVFDQLGGHLNLFPNENSCVCCQK